MKQALKDIGKFFTGILLFIIVAISFIPTVVLGFLFSIYDSIYNKTIGYMLNYFGNYFKGIAISGDIFINTAGGGLFDWLFIKDFTKLYYSFGIAGDTISKALGVNEFLNNQTKFAKVICSILDFIDKNHCYKAAKNYINANIHNLLIS